MQFKPEDYSIIAWLMKNQVKTENGKAYDLKSHPFWFDVMTDWNPKIVMLKAAQLGGSTTLALKMLWAVQRFGLNAAYTAPTDTDAHDFVSGKLNPIIRQNPVLDKAIKDKDSVEQKRIGSNTIYFRGTMTDRSALSFSSDLNVHDEVDRSKNEVVSQYASRLQHSKYKWEWSLSNPSSPGNGVDKLWKESDQKHWFITCQACSKKQFLSWPENIDIERKMFVCKHCGVQLTEKARTFGEWHGIKTEIKPEYSGYWFSLLMAPWVKAEEIIKLNQTKSPEYFANFVLGLPYVGVGSKITEQEFFDNLVSEVNRQKDPIVIGVDTGIICHYVIGNKQGIFYNGKCESMDDIEQLMQRFPKSIVVLDQGGDLTAPRALREKYPGRVYLAYYRQDRKSMRYIDWGTGTELGKVIIDRNRVIQQIMDELREKRIPIFGSREDWQEMWIHFSNVYRELELDSLGQERIVWQRSGPDHFLHALVYYRAGIDKFRNDGSKSVDGNMLGGLLNVKQSFEANFNNTMPSRFPHVETTKDWRDL